MANAIFKVFFTIISTIVNIITAPINVVIVNLFPNFADIINTFNNGVTTLIGGSIAFFSYLLPPLTRATILFWLGAVISFYTVSMAVHLIVKAITIIKNIKFW